MFSVTQRDPMLDLLHHLEHRIGRSFNGEALRAFEWPVPEAATTAWLPLVDIFERSEEHTSELQSRLHLVCRLLLEKKKKSSTGMNKQLIEHRTTMTIRPSLGNSETHS